jgi:uncharacterized membrane protein HdeD (DUF308 family)
LLAIMVGIVALKWAGTTLGALVPLFGVYALGDGFFAVLTALRAAARGRWWWTLLLEGVVGVGASALALTWPGMTLLVLLYVIATWAILIGVLDLVAAVEMRREVSEERLLTIGGLLSVAFGVLFVAFPIVTPPTFAQVIGAYALVFGAARLALGFSVRARARRSLLIA